MGIKNAFVGTASSVRIKSVEHYEELGYDETAISNVTLAARDPGTWANGIRIGIIDGKADQTLKGLPDITAVGAGGTILVGYGVTQAVPDNTVVSGTGTAAGTTVTLDGYWKGVVTGTTATSLDVKFLSHVSSAGVETPKDYDSVYKFSSSGSVAIHTNGQATSYATTSYTSQADWFDAQELDISSATVGGETTVSTVKWNTIAEPPTTSEYASDRGGRFDEVHVVVIDGNGTITGNAGTVLEKHLNLSKAKDAEFSVGSSSWWRNYIQNNSNYIFAGGQPVGVVTTGYTSAYTLEADGRLTLINI